MIVHGHLELNISPTLKLRFERLLPVQKDVFYQALNDETPSVPDATVLDRAFRRAEAVSVKA